jgi:formylglycine-generating enzyme required for sulfatase activity
VALSALLALSTCAGSAPVQPGARPPEPPPLERRDEVDASAGAALLAPKASGMVLVAGGPFRMGSPDAEILWAQKQCESEPLGGFCRGFADERPVHDVTLSPFFLDRTEVSAGAYGRCVDAGACARAPIPAGDPRVGHDELPISYVSHADAERYCAFAGGRLPTEAEWERAARGLAGRRFPWGELWNPHLANHGTLDFGVHFVVIPTSKMIFVDEGVPDDVDGFATLAPVGAFAGYATPEGIEGLAGNVSEWVQDLWEPEYDGAPARDPAHLAPRPGSQGLLRVARGGSYLSPFPELRGAARRAFVPAERKRDLGFRCARDAR